MIFNLKEIPIDVWQSQTISFFTGLQSLIKYDVKDLCA